MARYDRESGGLLAIETYQAYYYPQKRHMDMRWYKERCFETLLKMQKMLSVDATTGIKRSLDDELARSKTACLASEATPNLKFRCVWMLNRH